MARVSKDRELYRQDARHGHTLLSPAERERILKPYLPSNNPASRTSSDKKGVESSRFGVRHFLRIQLHSFIFAVIHTIFSIYIRIRKFYHALVDRILAILYYHHRTPELIQKDVKGLNRIPEHLSVILKLEDSGSSGAELELLVDEVAEISAWCACAGIPMLSVYESTGILKGYIPAIHRAILRKFASYFGEQHPALSLRAPHLPSMESSPISTTNESDVTSFTHINVLLISADDGRDSLVDLTKTLTEMSQRSKISPNDISIDLIDAEIAESVMAEPDLLILFGPTVELTGYPPWQIRLTEIFHVQDNQGVGYQVFLRALYSYAKVQMRFGR